MSTWPSVKAKRLLAALFRLGWQVVRERASHKTLVHPERPGLPYTFAFHDQTEVGPAMLAKVAKATGLRPEDL